MIRYAALKENKRQERENAIEDECEGPATSMHAVCVGAKHVKRGEQQATSRAESEPCACDGRPRGNDVHGLRGHEVHSLL